MPTQAGDSSNKNCEITVVIYAWKKRYVAEEVEVVSSKSVQNFDVRKM